MPILRCEIGNKIKLSFLFVIFFHAAILRSVLVIRTVKTVPTTAISFIGFICKFAVFAYTTITIHNRSPILLLSIALCTSLFFLHSLYDNRFKNKYVAFITISGTLRESTIDSHIHSRLPIIQIKNAIRFLKAISTLPSMLKNAASADSMSITSAHPLFPLPSSELLLQRQFL